MNTVVNIMLEGVLSFTAAILCLQLLKLVFLTKREPCILPEVCAALLLTAVHEVIFCLGRDTLYHLEFFGNVIIMTLLVRYLFEGKRSELLSIVWLYFVIIRLLELFLKTVLSYIPEEQSIKNTILPGLYQILYVLLLLLLFFLVKRRKKEKACINWKILLLYDVLGTIAIVFFQRVYMRPGTHYLLAAWEELFFYALVLFIIFVEYEHRQRNRQKYNMIELKNKMLEENYTNMLEIYRENVRLFHDFYAHMNVIKNYIQSQEIEKCEVYINEIVKSREVLEKYIWTGNEIIDLILNYKYQEALEKGVKLQVEADQLENLSIAEMDLCTIFSNLLDNAIENCDLEQNIISVFVKKRNELLLIMIRNSMRKECVIKDGRPVTGKENKQLHGIGLDSVAYSVSKNDGSFTYEIQEKCFVASVTLPF